MSDKRDYADEREYEEMRMKPYKWTCPIHGSGYAAIDECPKCMENSMKEDYDREFDWVPPICGNCGSLNFDDHICAYYGFWTKRFKGKKKCKRFQQSIPDDHVAMMEREDRDHDI
jgi:hypothetical protein